MLWKADNGLSSLLYISAWISWYRQFHHQSEIRGLPDSSRYVYDRRSIACLSLAVSAKPARSSVIAVFDLIKLGRVNWPVEKEHLSGASSTAVLEFSKGWPSGLRHRS